MVDILTQNLRKLRHQTELLEAFEWDEERLDEALDKAVEVLNKYKGDDIKGLIPYFRANMDELGYFDIEVSLLLKIVLLEAEPLLSEA